MRETPEPRLRPAHLGNNVGVQLTRASLIFPIGAFLERIGAPVERFLERAAIPPSALTDPESLIPISSTGQLLVEAARAEGIDNLGLVSGQAGDVTNLGMFGRLLRRPRTLGEALQAAVRHHRAFTSSGEIWLGSRGDDVRFCHAFTADIDRSEETWQQLSHYGLMLMLNLVRLGAGAHWRPAEVDLQVGETAALRDAEPLSLASLKCGQPATAITFPRALLAEPLRLATPDVGIPADTIEAWKASAPARDLVGSIVEVVEMLSQDCYPDIHVTAEVLGMGVRTLQRHLAAAGVTHRSLVGRARFATAAALLQETNTKVLEIALDLGYSDHAHFTRAFRRWAGCSPQEFRRKAQTSQAIRAVCGADAVVPPREPSARRTAARHTAYGENGPWIHSASSPNSAGSGLSGGPRVRQCVR